MDRDYISVDEAGELLQRGRATVWKLIRRHKLPTFKRPMDRKTYLRRADIESLPMTYEPRGEAIAAA